MSKAPWIRGRRLAVDRGEDARGDRPAGLERHGAELRVRIAFGVDGGRAVADRVQPREPFDTEVGPDADPAADVREDVEPLDRARLQPAGPHHTMRGDVRAVAEDGAVGFDGGDRGAELEYDALVLQHLGGVGVRLVGERGEHDLAVVDERDRGGGDVEVVIPLGHHLVHEVGERAGGLDARGAGTDDDEVQRAPLDARRVEVGILEQPQHAVAQDFGIDRRVQREGVLLGARDAEEVRFGTHGHHEVIAREPRAVVGGHGPGGRVDRHDLRELDIDAALLAEQSAQGTHHVAAVELSGRDLVQQRLELVVRVLVDEGHVDTGGAEVLRARHSGEAGADDHDSGRGASLSRGHARVHTVRRLSAPWSPRPRDCPVRSTASGCASCGMTTPGRRTGTDGTTAASR